MPSGEKSCLCKNSTKRSRWMETPVDDHIAPSKPIAICAHVAHMLVPSAAAGYDQARPDRRLGGCINGTMFIVGGSVYSGLLRQGFEQRRLEPAQYGGCPLTTA